jgi:eukaryotic-like serine/threonine-protein kinase
MKVTLTVIEGPHVGSSFAFVEHDAFLVGRSPEVQFRLPLRDRALSRVHFLVEVNPPSCRLLDMASTNGVRVNGKRVHAVDLRHGDQIQAGETVLAFAVEDDEETAIHGGPSSASGVPDQAAVETTEWPESPKFSGYRVDRKLGEGGMGVVYLARREGDDLPMALKVIKPVVATRDAVMGRFLREASILRKLEHPNIVRFLDIGFDKGLLYFAMEFVEGSNVSEALKAKGPFSIPAAVGLACQVLRALGYAHALGFVHRDIKPANILTTKHDGKSKAKLADFGLAKIYQESSLSGMSVTGQMGGTLAYMPPEQITHFREAKPPADIYSLGATLYILLAGRPIFDFKGRAEQQVARILFDEPTPIQAHRPEIPDALARAIHKALAKSPLDRFPDANSMKEALKPFAKSR